MSNPILNAIKSGNAPKPARLAAARGMLPLGPEEIFEALIILLRDPEEDVRAAASGTINNQDLNILLPISQNSNTSVDILSFLAVWPRSTPQIVEAIILNKSTPDEAIAHIASRCTVSNLLEAITINQQRMIRHPAILEGILANPHRSPEAERRAREVKLEFFEKELGAQRVAEEQKARERLAKALGAEFSDDEFQQVLAQFEAEVGITVEDTDPSLIDPEAELLKLLQSAELEGETVDEERESLYKLIAKMTVKQRIFLGIKGGRQARGILVRDANKMVSSAVLKNPRITDAEVEAVAKLKGISEEVLRLICMNRAWTSNYTIMHNLVCNPRTPMTFSMTFINRLQMKDLKALTKNKGVPDVLRTMANRLVAQRKQA